MRLDAKSMLLGATSMGAALVVAGAILMHAGTGGREEPRHRVLKLASGRGVDVTALYFAFGDEHSGRGAVDDGLSIAYVSAAANEGARDKEAAEVFEAIRPLSESLGVGSAEVSAFPSLVHKGHYALYGYTRDAAGGWTSKRIDAKVFVND